MASKERILPRSIPSRFPIDGAPPRRRGPRELVRAAGTRSGGGKDAVCVVGGGFGGLLTSLKLDALLWPEGKPDIVLVDKEERFLFKPLMYDYLTGECGKSEVCPRFQDLLEGTSIEFCRGMVQGIDVDPDRSEGTVVLESGRTIPYNRLVLALGSSAAFPTGIPGARELAVPFSSYQDMIRVQLALRELQASASPVRVAVTGGGVAGVELACAVASCLAKSPRATVVLVSSSSDIMERCPAGQREAARERLRNLNVEVLDGARVLSVESKGEKKLVRVGLSEQELSLEANLLLWTAGQAPSTSGLGGSLALPVDEKGSIMTDPCLRINGQSNLFALGDASLQSSAEITNVATAQVALQQSDFCAYNVWASLNGLSPVHFRYTHLGDMMTLGKGEAAITLPFGPGFTLNGNSAALARWFAYTIRQPTLRQQARVGRSLLEREGGEIGKTLGPLLQLVAEESDKLFKQLRL